MGETTKYLIIGGGVASVSAAKGIRQHDKEGRVILITSNKVMPYDRPPLSKDFLSHPKMTHDDISSKYDVWYTDNKIEVRLETTVSKIDRAKHAVATESGQELHYEKLLIATGSRARKLDSPSAHVLRTIEDGIALRGAIGGAKTVLVIGGGFLGPEVAGQCLGMGLDTSLITAEGYLWSNFASADLGHFLNGYFESKGLKLHLNEKVEGDKARDLKADVVLAAIGVHPNTELAKAAGLTMSAAGAIEVDDCLRTVSDPDIYAAGDVAYFPEGTLGKKTHHEHHLNAQWQGEAVGGNMAGQNAPYNRVPYFFSDFLDLHMILRGVASPRAQIKLLGSFENDFIELYAEEDGTLKMGIAISREEKKLDPISDKLEEFIQKGVHISSLTTDYF